MLRPRRFRTPTKTRILAGGKLFFATDRSYPVLTGGQGSEVALLLRRLKQRVKDCAAPFAQGVETSVTGMPTTTRMPCSFAVRSVSSGK